ncbi:MAG: 5-bromo-4-chloroindolyl phosphate hydrolysis family protein [Clostridiales Family XIII bacterium]|nr:5-bromo-4-chloroindolyl phosphate hydrolysis family protein [Clostridiales Family XIII bacterium]
MARNSSASATILIAVGIVGICLFFLGAVAFLVFFRTFWFFKNGFAILGLICLIGLIAMIFLLAKGVSRRRLIARMGEYSALFGNRTVLRFEDMAAELGISPQRIKRDLRKAQKFLHFDLRLDTKETAVIKGEDTYRQYLESERLREERKKEEAERKRKLDDPDTAPLEAFKLEGYAMLERIKAANFALPGERISLKLSALEKTTSRIFDYVGQYPEKLPETRKLMNYHLPITLKLVEKYKEYECMEFKPRSVVETKEAIEKTLDTVDDAFNNFLEHLAHHDTLDVATDIDVLNRMLEQEGLTGNKINADDADDA